MVNPLDRVMGFFAPKAALRRVSARKRLQALYRGYDGGKSGRRTQDWIASGGSADTELQLHGKALRERSRDLERNNRHVAKAITVHADNIVGEGIVPRANTGDEKLDEKVDSLFDEWSESCSPDGLLNYYGQQYVAVRGMVSGGEMLARQRVRRSGDGLKVPVQIQLLEPDHLDDSKQSTHQGRPVVSGIEFDRIGRRKGYWLFPRHPGDRSVWTVGDFESRRVPAEQIVHLYEQQRPQARGAPWTAPIILDVKDLDDYLTAERWRKKVEACHVGTIIPGDGALDDDADTAGVRVEDSEGKAIDRMEPGMFAVLRNGKNIVFNNPAVTLSQESYHRLSTRDIASGIRCPHVLMTGDTSQMNYSTFRADMLAYKKFVRSIQKHFVLKMYCRPTYGWFLTWAQTMGLIPRRPIPVVWTLPKFEHVNPIDDHRADLIAIRAGIKSLPQVIAENGGVPKRVLNEIAEYNKILDSLGLVLDSDPRHVTLQGQFQTSFDKDEGGSDVD